MKYIEFNIDLFPKVKAVGDSKQMSYSDLMIAEGFKSAEYIWEDKLSHTNEPTHKMNEKDYFMFAIQWSS